MINQISIDYLHDTLNSSTKRGLICLYYYYSKLEASPKTLEVNI